MPSPRRADCLSRIDPRRPTPKQAYPHAISSHQLKHVKEWKDKFVRYYELNPPEETGLKRKLSVENLVASAGAAMQSFRESLSPEKPTDEAAEKATPAKPTPAKPTPAKETPAKETPAKATPAKETPDKATPAKATPKESPPSKAEAPPAKAAVETPAKANGSTETAVVAKKPKVSMFQLMPCCTARPGRASATASASA